MGNAVVLQNDALLHSPEEAGDGAAHAEAATLVAIAVEPLDLAGSVALLLNLLPSGGHLLRFTGARGVGAVARPRTGAWGLRGGSVDHLAQGVPAAPGNQEEGLFIDDRRLGLQRACARQLSSAIEAEVEVDGEPHGQRSDEKSLHSPGPKGP